MKLGISTACLYPMLTEKAFRKVAELGIQCCEVFFNANCELNDSFTKELASYADFYGVPIVSVHPFTAASEPAYFFSEYPRCIEDGLEQYKKYFHAMNILNVNYLVFHGDFKINPFPLEIGFEHMARLCQLANSFGVQIAQENVARCKSSSLEYLKMLSDFLPDLRFTLDIKQAVRSQTDPFDILDLLKGKIVHCHLSDHTNTADCLPPGQGAFDFDRFFAKLKEHGFSGGMVIELYRHNFQAFEELASSYEYLSHKL